MLEHKKEEKRPLLSETPQTTRQAIEAFQAVAKAYLADINNDRNLRTMQDPYSQLEQSFQSSAKTLLEAKVLSEAQFNAFDELIKEISKIALQTSLSTANPNNIPATKQRLKAKQTELETLLTATFNPNAKLKRNVAIAAGAITTGGGFVLAATVGAGVAVAGLPLVAFMGIVAGGAAVLGGLIYGGRMLWKSLTSSSPEPQQQAAVDLTPKPMSTYGSTMPTLSSSNRTTPSVSQNSTVTAEGKQDRLNKLTALAAYKMLDQEIIAPEDKRNIYSAMLSAMQAMRDPTHKPNPQNPYAFKAEEKRGTIILTLTQSKNNWHDKREFSVNFDDQNNTLKMAAAQTAFEEHFGTEAGKLQQTPANFLHTQSKVTLTTTANIHYKDKGAKVFIEEANKPKTTIELDEQAVNQAIEKAVNKAIGAEPPAVDKAIGVETPTARQTSTRTTTSSSSQNQPTFSQQQASRQAESNSQQQASRQAESNSQQQASRQAESKSQVGYAPNK